MLAEVMPWLINNSKQLGIQAIHDYAGKRIWRPPSCSGRPATPSPECGWKPSSGPQMKSGNYWLHLEVLPIRWHDPRSVAEMLNPPKPPEPKPPDQGDDDMAQVPQDEWNMVRDRVLGSLPGDYSTEERAKDPPPEGRLFVLDNADGAYIVSMLQMIAAKLGL